MGLGALTRRESSCRQLAIVRQRGRDARDRKYGYNPHARDVHGSPREDDSTSSPVDLPDAHAILSEVDAGYLFASLFVSSVGYVAFVYGKRQRRVPQLVTGLTLLIFPYFVDSVALMLAVAAALVGLMWLAVKLGW